MSRNRKQGKPTKQALAKQDGEYTLEELEQRMLFSADVADAFLYDPSQANQPANEALVDENLELVDSASATADARVIELIFIDANTPDADTLISDLLTRQDNNREFEVITLDAGRDGIQQISEVLGERQDVDAIHIISHGNDGQVTLGNTTLSQDNLAAYSEQIQNWSLALDGDADILIYGCNLAATADGQTLIDNIAALTGADIAASDDLTGHASLGGDWELEYVAGSVSTEIVVSEMVQASWQGTLEQTLWLSTDSNVAGPGANGLPGGWTEGQVLDFGGGSLAHGDATAGDFSQVLDFDTFTVGTTDPGALHFVSRDMTVGGVNGTFDLKAGDVLVSFLQDETILAAYSDTGSDTLYSDKDMLVFRPTSFGNYSSGTFYLLLDEVVADDLKGATLIEQDTTIGGTDVAAGSFLIIAEVSGTTSVDLFVPTGVGAGTTTGSTTPFIDLTDLGIDANSLRGIEVIEAATTVGGQALAKGDILVTLNVDDNVSGVAGNNLLIDKNDVFVLTLTSTGAASTAGTAAMFLDGSDVGLDNNPSSENPYALALHNFGQLTVDTTSDESDGDTSSIEALILDKGADGKISLREAIEAANATPNGDTADVINFNITDALVDGAHTIMVGNLADGANGALPDITDAVIIDGTTDADFSGTPIIELDGSAAGTGDIAAGRRVILPWGHASFLVGDLNTDGETLMRRSLEWASDSAPTKNLLFVVQESAALNAEDTAKKALMESAGWDFNVTVIDVNDSQAAFDAAVASNDVVFITKDIASGDLGTKLRNAPIGVVSEELAVTDSEFGLNSSHSWDTGVLNLTIDDNTNYITSPFSTGALQVFDVAQELQYVTGTQAADLQTLGSTTGGSSMVIMEAGGQLYNGSSVDGLYITAGNTTVRGLVINQFSDSAIEIGTGSGNVIEGNYIGTDVTGALDPGNGLVGSGIVLWGGTANNVIGGTDAGAGNIIANQVDDGIYLNDDAGTGTTILGNTIYNNGGMGIELVESGPTWGVTANDAGDSDTGANNLQNYPLITTAALSGTDLALDGSLDTDGVATQYRIEFYGNTAGNQDATNGEGRFYLGATTVTTDGSGNASFTDVILSGVTLAAGDYVTATATEITDAGQVGTNDQLAYGDTSEFAVNFAITTAYVNFSVSSTSSISEDVPETATFTVVVSGDALVGANTASVDIVASGSAVSGTDYDNFIAAIASAAGATAGVSFDGTDTLTFDSTFNGNTGLGNFVFTVDAIDDVAMEGTETIVATLSNPGNVGGNAGFGNTVSDSYTEASNTNITAHTPDSGLPWTKIFDNSSYEEAFIDASLDVIQGGFRASSENDTGQAYAAGPAPGSVDQTISFTLSTIETDNGTKPVGLFGRYVDDNNFYYLRILPNANGQDSISLWKMAAGTPQQLATIDATIADGDTFKLEITDASKKVYHNDVEVLSSADNAHTAAGKWGFFIGNFSGIGGHYRDTWQIDDFFAESGVGGSSATTNITESDTNNAPTDLQVVTTEEGGTNVNNDGGNDAYFVADNGGGLLGGLTKVTVESTFSVTTAAADNTTLLSYASGTNDEELGLFLKNDGRIWFTANSAGAPYQSTAGNYMQLFDGEKHQVSVSWNATNGAVDFYIDGAFAESFTGYQTGKTISGGGELVFGQDQDSELGGWNTIDTFSGTFYDVRIFNDVRTLGEVAAGYDQTLPPTEAGMIANWTFGDLSTGGVITDAVSGNNLTLQHVSGGGFSASNPELELTIAEDAPDLTVVGSVAALDPDTGETFTYSLQNNAGGRFQITAGGDISVANSSLIDFEAASFHDITVRATDAGLLTYDEVFRVYVTNINEAPTVNATASDTGTEDTDQVYTHAQMLTLIGAADVDDADAALTVAITNVVNGSVALSGGTGGAGTTFTFTPTANFVGNMTFDYQVSDDDSPTPASSAVGTATVALSAVNDAPTVNATASDTGTEDTDQVYTHAQMLTLIGAADVDDVDANLTIAITNVINGSVVLTGGTGGAGTTFTFTPTANFVGNMTFDYQVSDDEAPTPASSAVGTATVTLAADNDAPVLDASEANLWLSTSADVSGSTANGLANWSDGDLLRFTAPGLGFGENATNGNFSTSGFNLDNFAGDADIDALHYVSKDILLGSGADTLQLRTGDILFSTESGENLASTNALSVASKDLVLFRADTPGDYSAGTFTIVLDDPLGGEIKGATLVEQNIWVGDANLAAGSFILSKGDKKLYYYAPVSVGETTTSGPAETTLVDGTGTGVNIDENIFGVHLVQQTTTTGGVTLNAGQLLVTLNNEDNSVGTGPVDTERRDVIVLTITQTGPTTIGDASLFFDGDDVGLASNDEDLDALTLVAQPRLTPIYEDIGNPANTGTLIADLINNIFSDIDGDTVGIAITAIDEAFGTWEYSIDGGSNWLAVGSVSDNLARVLSNSANDLVRFVPSADYSGNAGITFRAWDGSDTITSGTANVNTIPNGGSSAFSTVTVDAVVEVRSVNDPIELNVNATDSTPENTPLVFNAGNANLISITDIDGGAGELEVTLTATTGTVTLGNTTGLTFSVGDGTADSNMTFRGSLADLNTALDGLAYTPVTGYAGATVLNINVEELGNNDLGDNSSAQQSIDIDITPDATNDAPINTVPGTQATNEETPLVLSEANGNGISLVDDSGANPIEVTLTADNGLLTLDNRVGPEFTINATTADTQKEVQILTTATGTGIAVWNSKSLDTSGEGIFGQLYDSNGLPLGDEFQVNTFFADHQSEPDIAAAADGSFVVVWQSKNQDLSGEGIYAQRFDAAGNKVGVEFRVNSFTADDQQLPAVAMNASGEFVVTWQSKNQDTSGEGIYAQRYDNAGNTVGGELLVTTIIADNQKNPDVAMDTAGNFVVVWDSKGYDADKEAIVGRRFEVGSGFGVEFQINSYEPGDQEEAVIAMQSTGEFVVAWSSNGQDGGGKGIFAQRFDNSTLPVALGLEIQVNTTTSNNQHIPAISINASGEFTIAWQSKAQDNADGKDGVYARNFAADGSAIGGEFLLNGITVGNQRGPSISLLNDGSVWAAWDNKEIFSQRFQSSQALSFTVGDGIADATMTFSGTQADINAALDGLVYIPNVDFVGADTVTITTNDNGYTGGGSLTDIDAFTINVAGINDAPVVTVPALQSTTEDIPLVFSTGNGNLVSISDIDADAGLVELSLTATNGSMSLNGTTGLTFSVGDGTADTAMTFQGTVTNINAALDGLSFTSPTDYVGLGQIRLTVDDLGNTGAGGSLVDSAAVYIDITADAVNDAPTIQPPADFALPIDTNVTFDGANLISILDDADQNSIELTLTVTNGTVTFNEQIDTEHLVNTVFADAQLGAVVAAAPNGSYVIVWQSKNQDGNGEGIFAQVYDAFGNEQGSEIQVNTEFAGNQITPTVAMNSLGNFVVAWESDGNLDGDGRGIFVQMFSAEGQKVDIEFQGNTTANDDQTLPAIGMDDLGNFVLVWQSKNQDGNGEGIFAQRFDANGYALDDEFQVNSTFGNDQIDPAVAVDANGDFVIVWTSTNQDVDGDGIFAQRYDANGVAQGVEFQVNFDGAKHQRAPAVAIDALGNFVVAWQSENQDTNGYGIYARRFDAAGNALDPADVLINTEVNKHQIAPSISMNAVGEYIIAWQSQDQDTDGEGTYGQWFNASGTAIGGEVRLNTTVTNDQTAPSVAITGSGDYIAAWTSKNQDTNAEGIYARHIASPGGLNFTTGDGVDDNSIVVTGRPDRINAALDGMTFTPTPGFNGLATIQIDVDDLGSTGVGGPYTDTHTINIVYNTAPTLDNSGTPSFTAINEDDIGNSGDLVSSIIASGAGGNPIDDVDAGASEGIAVIVADNTNGSWEYSINGGGLWTAFGAVSNSSAVLLGDGANDRIRFVPNANYNGAAGNITFRAWDATDGNASGTTGVNVSVNGGNTSYSAAAETAGITVNPLNDAPVLAAIGNQTIDELATLSFTATATDSDDPADTLTYSLDAASLALGMTINSSTGDFSWTPTESQGGLTPSVTITVTDDGTGALFDSETFTITVNDTNTAPVLGAIGNQTVDELATLSFTASATDSDDPADTLTYSLDAASLALGMTINSSTGDFSWTPTESQGGLTPSVTITVTDDGTGALFDSETFTITVNDTNTAPVLGAIGNQTIDETSTLSFTASATDSDDPADTLTYSLDAASLALGMTINSSTGDFSWTPTESQGGLTPSVTITVTDDGTGALFDSETFTITVNDTNTAPVLGAIGNQTIDETSTLSFTASATDSDDPADTLTYSLDAASLALGMTINSSTGDFSWTPTESQGGLTPSVTITVTDDGTGALFDSETFTITVNDTNTAPVLGAIGNQTIDETSTLSFTASATDSDDPADTLTYSLDAASLALGMTINSSTGDFSWTPTESQGGLTPSVTITVTDDGTGALFDSENFTITVNDTNTAPVLGAIGNQTIDETSTLSFTASATDSDDPADTLTYSLDAASLALGMTINSSTGDFSWTPTESQGGLTPSVTITVTDDGTGSLFDSETFTITVNDTNTAPVLGAIGNQTIDENTTLSFTASATDSDDPADTLTYSLDAASLALGMTINSSTGDFSWTPTESQGGLTPSVTITVTDDGTGALFDSETFTITVNDTNTAPVLGAIGNQTIDELATLSFTASATDSDDPSDTLTYSLDAASLALGMTINSSTGDFSWTPTESQGGLTPSVTITVTDDGTGSLFDSETFTITVNDTNTAPVLGAIGNQTIDETSTLSFTASATDSDDPADTLTYSLDAASLALGMTINSSTGDFSWTPTESQGGLTPSVTITVTDDGTGALFDSETFTITVNDTNTAPVLGAIGNQTVAETNTLAFTATATDSDLPTDTLTYSLDAASLALGMTINSSTGDFSWTPTESQGGLTPSVTITVTDDGTGALFDNETFTITVNDTNTAPVLGAIGNQTVDELATLSFTASATDSDDPSDTLTYSLDAASLALGMTINSSTGDFSWTPTESQGGLTPSVTITVTDDGTGALFDSETFTITVNDTNTAPVLGAIGNQTVDELATLAFTATATDPDLPADTLTWSLDAASLALGMTINNSTGDFSWTPTEAQGGTTPSVTITVTDDGTGTLFDSETFIITVNEVNNAPVLGAIGNQTVNELVTLSFTATATDSDVPGDNLTYSLDAASLALGMTINSSTGDFSWTPTESQGGLTPSVTITVTDDGTGTLFDSETFTITVNDTNTAPVLGAIGNQTIDETSTLSFTASATDSDDPADTLTYSLDAASLALGMTINSSTGDFSWTPTESQGGLTPSVTITVTDDGTGALFDSETFTITVNDTNTAPVLGAIGNQTIDENTTLSFTASATDSDDPSDTLTYSLDAASLALGMTINSSTGDFSWTPTESQGGLTPSVTITVTDDGTGSLFDSETFTITVNDTNTAPVLGAIGNQTIDETSTLSFTASATDSDDPSDTLTYSLDAASLALGMTINSSTGDFSWTPTESQGGLTPSVTITVTDDGTGALFDNETFTITVNDTNTAPVLGAIGNQTIDENTTLSFTASATDSDDPSDTLTYSLDAASLALGMTINSSTGDFSWTPTESQGGLTPSVTITVTDDGTGSLFDSETFTITVNDTNTAPVLGAIGNQTIDETSTLSFTASATDSDDPSDTLTYSLDAASLALGMTINSSTGDFSWTPTESQGGLTPSVTITVTDDGTGSLFDSETFTITVNDTNTAPVLGAIGNQTVDELATLSFTATATDSDDPADTLTYSLDAASLALGMTINSSTGDFSWTPTESQGGTTPSVTITVTDDGTGNLVDSETFTITVNDTNTAPVLGAIGNQTVDELASLSFTATAADSDDPADNLTFSLDAASLALGMTINSSTGDFSWTPTESQGGSTPSVTITVTDDGTGNLVDNETFTITVNDVNVAPVLGAIGNQTVDELATLSFTATATDSDLPADTLTYSLDAASLALGMTINSSSGDFSWTPTESQGGTAPSATITVTDDGTGNLVDSETFTITVNEVNNAPVLGAIGNQTVDELVTLAFTATATDSDLPADTLTFSLDAASLALGMTINSSTGDFSWTPTESQGGTTPSVTITVTDDGTGNLFDSETFTITVNDTNSAPVLGAIGNQSIDELATLSFTATATDSDLPADTLTFSLDAASLALGMNINSNTGDFSWTPTESQGGTAPSVTITVMDDGTGNLVDSETFTITVNDTNTAPVLGAIGNQTIDELATLSFTATATDSDLPADTLTFSLDAASLALGMTINSSTGDFSWTPTESQGGTTPSVTITVTDDGTGNLFDSETFTITVNDLNTAPVLGAIGNQTVDELVTLSFTATATDSDLPADNLSFSLDAASIALGMTINSSTGDFSWTPTESQGGTAPSVTITVTDDGTGNLFDSETFTITVNDINLAPVAVDDAITATEDTLFTSTLELDANDTDPDGDSLTVVAGTYATAQGGSLVLAADGRYTYTAAADFTGTDSVDYTVTDGNLTDVGALTITVNPVNDTPVIGGTDIGAVTEDVDPDADTLLETGGALTIADPDAGESSFVAGTVNGTYGDLLIDSIGNWSYSADNTQPAIQQLDALETLTDTLTVTTADGSTHDVIITINGADDLPVATDDSGIAFTTDEDTAFTTGDVLGNDTAGDGPTTVSAYDAVSANGGSISYNGDGTFTYTPAADFNGSDTFTYTIVDNDNDTSIATVTITVNAVNDAPDAVGDSYTLLQNSSLDVTANGLLANDSDVDGDSLTATLVDGTVNGTLTLNSDGTFSYVPDAGFVGDDSFSYLANDGVADSQLVTVLLQVAPVLEDVIEEPIEDTTIAENDDPVTPPTDSDTGDDQDDAVTSETSTDNDGEVDPENLISRTSGWEETTLDEMIDEIVLLDEDAVAELLGETLFEPVDNSVVEVTRADPVRTADRTPRVPFEPNSNLKYGGTYEYDAILNDHALWKEVEAMQAAMEEAFDAGDEQGDMFVKVSAGTSLTLTAGFVSYLLRAGTLLSSMLSFLPVWKGVDPLAVLVTKPQKKDKKKNKDEDELENEQVSEDRQGDVDHLFNKGSE